MSSYILVWESFANDPLGNCPEPLDVKPTVGIDERHRRFASPDLMLSTARGKNRDGGEIVQQLGFSRRGRRAGDFNDGGFPTG